MTTSTIIHDVHSFPKAYDYYYGDIMELGNEYLTDIKSMNIDEAWYWYACGSYEGAGQILMRKGSLWDVCSLGHCSCYGPTEHIKFYGRTVEDLKQSLSVEYLKELENLFVSAGVV